MSFEINGNSLRESSLGRELIEAHLSPIYRHFDDPTVNSIAVNQYDIVFVRRFGVWERTEDSFESEAELQAAISYIFTQLNQQVDSDKAPLGDGRLPDGSRVNAVLKPTAHRGTNMTIRLFPKVRFSLSELIGKSMLTQEMADFLSLAVVCEYNMLTSGVTGCGKTTLLNALLNLTPEHIRMGIIEDTAELDVVHPNIVFQEAPKRSLMISDRRQDITMVHLLENILRQEVSFVGVGEVRTPTAAEALLKCIHTGHYVKSTIHSESTKGANNYLINLLLSTDTRIPYEVIKSNVDKAFQLYIHCGRTPRDGIRVMEIAQMTDKGMVPLYVWDAKQRKHRRFDPMAKAPSLLGLAEIYEAEIPESLKDWATKN